VYPIVNLTTLLKNPFVAGGLCLAAVVVLYFNVVSPLLPRSSGGKKVSSMPAARAAKGSLPASLRAIAVGSIEKALNSDTLKHTDLKTTGWGRQNVRDPFSNRNSTGAAPVLNGHPSGVPSLPAPQKIALTKNKPVLKKDEPPRHVSLEAIAKGPHGNIASIDSRIVNVGDTCALGLVIKIESDFVVIKDGKKNRTYTLHLSKTTDGD
jgi:hypothetical protein